MLRSAVSSMRDSVVLPAPDGDDSTSIRPRRAIGLGSWHARHRSLQVLHLLAELLDHGLELQADIGQLDVVGLGAQRIRFAVELLRQKIELAADRAAVGEQLARLRDMRGEPVELLADVGLGGEQDRLLMQPVGIEALRGSRAASRPARRAAP